MKYDVSLRVCVCVGRSWGSLVHVFMELDTKEQLKEDFGFSEVGASERVAAAAMIAAVRSSPAALLPNFASTFTRPDCFTDSGGISSPAFTAY